MLDPKRFSPTGPVAQHTEREALVETKSNFQKMITQLDSEIKAQITTLAKANPLHIHPCSFQDIYSSGEYTTEIYDINTWFLDSSTIAKGIVATTLPATHKIVIDMETRQKEKTRLKEELKRVTQAIDDYDKAPDSNTQRQVLEGYYKKSHTNEIYRSNDRTLLGVRGMGANHNIRKMEENDKKIDEAEARKIANPNSIIVKATMNTNQHFRANYQAVLRGRKIRSESEQKVILLSHALKVQKYQKKAAKLEAKRDAAISEGNAAKADKYQAKVDKDEQYDSSFLHHASGLCNKTEF